MTQPNVGRDFSTPDPRVKRETKDAAPSFTYCGWGYEPGEYGATVCVFQASDGTVIGVANPRYEADEDGPCIEWDRVGSLPAECLPLAWPAPRDLVLGDLTAEWGDAWHDLMHDDLKEVLRD